MYSFVAFCVETGGLLSHNAIAVKALQEADQLAPRQSIRVIHAGELGAAIWAHGMSLERACAAVDKRQVDRKRRRQQAGPKLRYTFQGLEPRTRKPSKYIGGN
jgi:hypothetical protein